MVGYYGAYLFIPGYKINLFISKIIHTFVFMQVYKFQHKENSYVFSNNYLNEGDVIKINDNEYIVVAPQMMWYDNIKGESGWIYEFNKPIILFEL